MKMHSIQGSFAILPLQYLSNINKMICVKIIFLLLIVIKANGIEILSTNNQFTSLSGLDAFPLYQNFLMFQIKGCRDANIVLKSKPVGEEPYYYISIGGWGNSKSHFEKFLENNGNVDEKDFVALDCNAYKDFWISWDKGKILVGKGDTLDMDIFLSYNEPCPFKIQDIEVTAAWSATITWLIDTAQFVQKPVVLTKRKRVVQIKTTTCPTFRVLSTVTGASRVECVSLCLSKAECGSIQFDDITKTCKFQSTVVDTTDESMHQRIIIRQ